jgi:hypothetical protein
MSSPECKPIKSKKLLSYALYILGDCFLQKKGIGNREQGTGGRGQGAGGREQIRNTHLHQFKAQSKKRCFYKMRSTKKTVSLFQSHV